jgi:hypothetical protein
MVDALQVVKFSLRDFWDEFVMLAVLNVLWSLTVVLPIVPLFVFRSVSLIGVLAISLPLAVPLPIVSGALCFVTNQVARGRTMGWGTFAVGLKSYWAKSLGVGLMNLIVLVLITVNIQFYGFILDGTWATFALSAWLSVGIYWLLAQVFWFPMILELESEKMFLALRNALVMVIITPGFSLTVAVLVVVIGAVCIVLSVPAVLIMASLLLLISNHATRSRLAHVQKKPYRPGLDLD